MNAETYLEILRDAHIAAIQRGAPLTGGESMGLGERIRSDRSQELDPDAPAGVPIYQHGYSVPSESRELNAFADMALAEQQIGLTRNEIVDLLVNTFKVDLDELVYAWDIPTYPVMREGVLQEEGDPEFFLDNPLKAGTANAMGGAYRPNNWWVDRQGRDMSQSVTTEQAPMGGAGYDPNNALKRFGRQRVRAHPDAQGPMYEQIYDVVPDTATGWAVEAALAMMFGPTGIYMGRHAGSRLLGSVIRNFDSLPPSMLGRFEKIRNWLNPPDVPHPGIPGDPGGADAIEDAMGHLNEVLANLPSLEQWTREMDVLFPNLRTAMRRAGGGPGRFGPGWRPGSLAEERKLAAEIESWMKQDPDLTLLEGGGEPSPRTAFDQDLGPQRPPDEGGRAFPIPDNMAERNADIIPLRPDKDTYGIMTIQDIADLQNVAPSEVTEAHIREAIRAGAVTDEVGARLLGDLGVRPAPFIDPAQGTLWEDIERTRTEYTDPFEGGDYTGPDLSSERGEHPFGPLGRPVPMAEDFASTAEFDDAMQVWRDEMDALDEVTILGVEDDPSIHETGEPHDLFEEDMGDWVDDDVGDRDWGPSDYDPDGGGGGEPPDTPPPAAVFPEEPSVPFTRHTNPSTGVETVVYNSESPLWDDLFDLLERHLPEADYPNWMYMGSTREIGEEGAVHTFKNRHTRQHLRFDGDGTPMTSRAGTRTGRPSSPDTSDLDEHLALLEENPNYGGYGPLPGSTRTGRIERTTGERRFRIREVPVGEHLYITLTGPRSGAESILDEWDPIAGLDLWREHVGEPGSYDSADIRIGDTEFHIERDPGLGEVSVSWGSVAEDLPSRAGTGRWQRMTTHQEGLKDMSRLMDYLSENGVSINMQVDPLETTLVKWYTRHGFTLTDEGWFAGDLLTGRRSPKDWFHTSGLSGQSRAASGVDFPHEEGWGAAARGAERANYYALGKLNGYTDDEIAHFYLLKGIEPDIAKIGQPSSLASLPFRGSGRPGRNPYGLDANVEAMATMNQDQLDTAYKMWLDDKAEFMAHPDYRQQIADAATQVTEIGRFKGDVRMHPKHDIGEGIKVSDIINLTDATGFGTRRSIAIVDMGDAGMQPFFLHESGRWLPFDGFGQSDSLVSAYRTTPYTTGPNLTPSDDLWGYGTEELKRVGSILDNTLDFPHVQHEYTMVKPNQWGGELDLTIGKDMNEILGVLKLENYNALLARRFGPDGPIHPPPNSGYSGSGWSDGSPGPWMRGGPAYAVGGVMTAADFMRPILREDTDGLRDALAGTTRGETPTGGVPEEVKGMMAWQAQNHDGWWSWIKDYPEHLNWATKVTGATLDGMATATHSTGNQVLDGLSGGFRQQAYQFGTRLREGAVPLVGREDPEMLQGVSRDLSERGHNGNAIFSNDVRKEIENGDAMIVGYRSDADYQRAMQEAQRFGVTVDGPIWRKPSSQNIRPAEGQPWTREHLKKIAAADFFEKQGPR